MVEPSELFGEPLPMAPALRTWLVTFEVREEPQSGTGTAIVAASTPALAGAAVRQQIHDDNPEFWDFCHGPSVDVLSVEEANRV